MLCKLSSFFNWCMQELDPLTSQGMIQPNAIRITDIFPICMPRHHSKKHLLSQRPGPIRVLIAVGNLAKLLHFQAL